MIWIFVLIGAVVGAVAALIYTRMKSSAAPGASCSGNAESPCQNASQPPAQGESGCPLCSTGVTNVFAGAMIGAIIVLLGSIASGAISCPFSTCAVPPATEPSVNRAATVPAAGAAAQPVLPEAVAPESTEHAKPATGNAEAQKQPEKHYAKPLKSVDFQGATAKGPVVLDLWAEWCGPCRTQGPIFEKLAQKYEGKVKFYKVNVDEERPLASRFQADAIPALIFMLDGEVVAKKVGLHEEDALEKLVLQLKDNPLPLLYPFVMRQP